MSWLNWVSLRGNCNNGQVLLGFSGSLFATGAESWEEGACSVSDTALKHFWQTLWSQQQARRRGNRPPAAVVPGGGSEAEAVAGSSQCTKWVSPGLIETRMPLPRSCATWVQHCLRRSGYSAAQAAAALPHTSLVIAVTAVGGNAGEGEQRIGASQLHCHLAELVLTLRRRIFPDIVITKVRPKRLWGWGGGSE